MLWTYDLFCNFLIDFSVYVWLSFIEVLKSCILFLLNSKHRQESTLTSLPICPCGLVAEYLVAWKQEMLVQNVLHINKSICYRANWGPCDITIVFTVFNTYVQFVVISIEHVKKINVLASDHINLTLEIVYIISPMFWLRIATSIWPWKLFLSLARHSAGFIMQKCIIHLCLWVWENGI